MGSKIVCITGTVWSADAHAPQHRLEEAGFRQPEWFTTSREITDAHYKRISETQYHLAEARHEVLLHVEYGGGFMGILRRDFESALEGAQGGVLVVGPPEVAAQIARLYPDAIVFALKCVDMKLSEELEEVARSPRFHRIDIESWEPGAWSHAFERMLEAIADSKTL